MLNLSKYPTFDGCKFSSNMFVRANPLSDSHDPWTSHIFHCYPLVNIQKTMEHHHFWWLNQLFLWPFSSSQTVNVYQTRGYIRLISHWITIKSHKIMINSIQIPLKPLSHGPLIFSPRAVRQNHLEVPGLPTFASRFPPELWEAGNTTIWVCLKMLG